MASWTDNPQIAFNPYVQQLPVEAMVGVGTELQRRYDEGVQKIQSSIDRVAGLDIMKDKHKSYLQSKLNDLGTRLRTVAAGDFSNYQLTNHVAGMASSVGKDPVIINAVVSTQRIRKGQSDIETARKEGKSSVVNESYWNYEVNEWLKDDNLEKSFDGSYIPYKDIDKKLRDIAKEIPEIARSVDIPYRRDAQGNVIYYQKDKAGKVVSASTNPAEGGSPEIDDAMLTIKTKGKSAQKLLDNFYASLDADDLRQMKMDSWYHYRGATPDKFKNDAIKIYNDSREMLSNQVVELNMELTTGKDMTSAERSVIQAKIKSINDKLSDGSLEKIRDAQIKEIDGVTDLDDYKYRLYTQRYLTDKAKALAYESYEQEIKNNPYFQAYMDRANLQLGYDRIRNENENKRLDRQWDMTKFYAGLAAKQQESGIIVTPGRIPTDIDPPSLLKLDEEIKAKENQIKQLTGSYVNVITPPDITDPKKKAEYLDKLSQEYATDPSFIKTVKDPNIKTYLERRRALEIVMGQKQNLYQSASKESSKLDADIAKVLSSEEGIRFSDGTGYSSKELYDIMVSVFSLTKDIPATSFNRSTPKFGTTTELDVDKFEKAYKGTKYEPLARAIIKQHRGQSLTSTEQIMINRASEIHRDYGPKVRDIQQEKLRVESEYLARKMPERQTMIGTLDSKNEQHRRIIEGVIGNKKLEYETGGVDSEFKRNFNPETIDKMRGDPQTTYTIVKKYNESGGPTADLVLSLGGTIQIVPMNSREFNDFFPNEARTSPIENIKYMIIASPNNTTNMSGRKDESGAVNAYLSGYNIPLLASTDLAGIVRFDIEGAAFNDGSDNDMFAIRMYVNDGGTWKTDLITGNEFVSEQKIQEFLNNIGPATVSDFLRRNQ